MAVARGRLSLPYVDIDLLNHDPLEGLTARERELLAALANGWTNLQIAARTGITRNTVKYHLKNLYDKLGVSNRAMAVALFMSATRPRRLTSLLQRTISLRTFMGSPDYPPAPFFPPMRVL